MKRKNWTKEETIVAFNVYCKVPFNASSKTHPTIIKYAKILGRSPSALNMKIGNFGRLDPELKKQGIVGLRHGSKLEEEVWNEFNNNWEKLAYESELLISKLAQKPIEEISGIEVDDIKEGLEKEAIIKQRVNQSFFRSTVLSAYNFKCCITGLSIPDFLIASHIIPWATNKEQRLNPRNGLCLNSIHDKAFDKGYITITPDYKVKISEELFDYEKQDVVKNFFLKYNNHPIILPDKFLPSKEFLDYHYQKIFRK